jgi:phage gp36-like protein
VYCSERDVYAVIPRGSIPSPGRLVASALSTTSTFSLDGHGYEDGDALTFRAEEGGTLPSGIALGTTYYAIRLSDHAFRVSTESDGSAPVTLTTNGDLVLVIHERPVATAIEWASAHVDQMLPAHAVPLESPYPAIVVSVTAELAAFRLRNSSEREEGALVRTLEQTRRLLERWGRGVPIRGTNAPAPSRATNLAIASSGSSADRRLDTIP